MMTFKKVLILFIFAAFCGCVYSDNLSIEQKIEKAKSKTSRYLELKIAEDSLTQNLSQGVSLDVIFSDKIGIEQNHHKIDYLFGGNIIERGLKFKVTNSDGEELPVKKTRIEHYIKISANGSRVCPIKLDKICDLNPGTYQVKVSYLSHSHRIESLDSTEVAEATLMIDVYAESNVINLMIE